VVDDVACIGSVALADGGSNTWSEPVTVGRCRLTLSNPVLKALWCQRLKLNCYVPLSNVAFDCNLRRYITVARFVNQMLLRPSLHYEQAEAYTRPLFNST